MSTKRKRSSDPEIGEAEEDQIAKISAQLQTLVESGVLSDEDVTKLLKKVDDEARATAGLPARDLESFKRHLFGHNDSNEEEDEDQEEEDEWEDEESLGSDAGEDHVSEAGDDKPERRDLADDQKSLKQEDEKPAASVRHQLEMPFKRESLAS